MRNCFFLLIIQALLLCSCKKNDDNTPAVYAGTWAEEEQTPQFAGTNYKVLLTADGRFEMSIFLFTDVIVNDPCLTRTDYIQGNWHISGHNILFTGYYTDSSFSNNQGNACSGDTDYNASFRYELRRADTLMLDPQADAYRSIKLVRQ